MAKDQTREVCAEIVRLLTEERKRQKISMNSLAAKAGLSQSLISGLEATPWNPTVGTLLRFANALEVDLGKIISQARKNIR